MVKHGIKSKAQDTKLERKSRRHEVARLHFDLGYSGLDIAHLMKRDKKTIYKDIECIYDDLAKEHKEMNLDNFLIKHITRLEKQRGQIVELKNKQSDFDKIMSAQKLILEIESKLSNITLRTRDIIDDNTKDMIKMFNHAVDEYNKDEKKKSKYSDRIANNYNQGFKDGKFKMIFE